ncbi:MAG TPA: DUF2188 domain-containing protein [Burkholderiales bacterium]|jgi:hypothetical protein|nr:DUF2188 domain-containing protein [Burkholderiales bacterium]
MSKNIFIERRDQGDYAVRRPSSKRASAVESTQAAAIERAKEISPNSTVHVERVRNTSAGHPDKWRKP